MFELATQARSYDERTTANNLLKEETMTIMPYFLSHQYKEVLEASQKQLAKLREQGDKKASSGPAGMYKSQFMRDKLEA